MTNVSALKSIIEIMLFATSQNMDRVMKLVNDDLDCERKSMSKECLEKCLYHGSGGMRPVTLFGLWSGSVWSFKKGVLTVDVVHSKLDSMDDKEFLSELENSTSSSICAIHKFTSTDKGVSVMFLTSCAARKALELNESEFNGSILNVAQR